MIKNHRRVGIGLIAAGVLLLLVTNRIGVGWTQVWPLIPLVAGGFSLRAQRVRRTPELLFAATTSSLLGVFFLLFSLRILDWGQMRDLWPVFPLVAGVALIAVASRKEGAVASVVVGVGCVVFATMGFLYEAGTIAEKVAAPFLRLWPIVLVTAGAMLLRLGGKSQPALVDEGGVVSNYPHLEDELIGHIRAAGNPDTATRAMVVALFDNFRKYTWVGVYRLADGGLSLADNDFVGQPPEDRNIPLSQGICGAAAIAKETIIVDDVCNDPRYIACSPTVKSEIVVPIFNAGELVGVLDIDSDEIAAFDRSDRRFLEALLRKTATYIAKPSKAGVG